MAVMCGGVGGSREKVQGEERECAMEIFGLKRLRAELVFSILLGKSLFLLLYVQWQFSERPAA